MKKALFYSVLLCAFTAVSAIGGSSVALAQRYAQDTRTYFDFGDPYYTSMTQSPDGRTVNLELNTSNAMFSFLRSEKQKDIHHGAYYGIRDVSIEVVEHGVSQPVVSHEVLDTVFESSYDRTIDKDVWHALNTQIKLPELDHSKQYGVRVEVRDGILDRPTIHPILAELRVPNFRNATDSTGIAIGDVALFDRTSPTEAVSKARGNTYMFSRDIKAAVPFQLADTLPNDATVEVTVKQVTNLIDPTDIGQRAHMVLTAAELRKNTALQFEREDSEITYKVVPGTSDRAWTAMFTVPGQQFQQGKYEFSVRVNDGGVVRTRTNNFMIVWQDMPISLEDPVDAVQPLAHILSDDQLKDLRTGDKQEMIRKLYAYWKNQDPTPGTAFNERMAAFYQRVDYADFNFATSHLLDGVMTDRGKIYLLYGQPTSIERTFLPGQAPVETWAYSNNVKRVFRFEDHGNHDYRLVDVQSMASAAVQ